MFDCFIFKKNTLAASSPLCDYVSQHKIFDLETYLGILTHLSVSTASLC